MLSAPENEVVDEVSRLKAEISEQKYQIAGLQQKLLEYKVLEVEQGSDLAVMFEESLEGNMARDLVNLLMKREVRVGAVFVGEKDNYRYVIGSQSEDVRPIAKMLNDKFQGRGGGKPEMVQGSLNGSESEIREAMEHCRKEDC